jgi:hypothetical protein
MNEHWIDEHKEQLREKANQFGFKMSISGSEVGPVEFEHSDGSEISFVDTSDKTGTYGVEYVPSEESIAAVKLNKQSFTVGDYHHDSWGTKKRGTECIINIMEQHAKKN